MGIRLCVSGSWGSLLPFVGCRMSFALYFEGSDLFSIYCFVFLWVVLTRRLPTDMMKVYARRIEVLATKAVTAKVWG